MARTLTVELNAVQVLVVMALSATHLWSACDDANDGWLTSETHWLTECDGPGDCTGSFNCICGVCTLECVSDEGCTGVGQPSSCGEYALIANTQCANYSTPESNGICLPSCLTGEDCLSFGTDYGCEGGLCVRSGVDSGMFSDVEEIGDLAGSTELLVNGDFDSPIEVGWRDERPEGDIQGIVEIVSYAGHSTSLRLDSRDNPNYYIWFSQSVDVSTVDLTEITLSWDWLVDEIVEPYGLTHISVSFFQAGDEDADGYFRFQRHAGWATYNCDALMTEWAGEMFPGYCLEDTDSFAIGTWSSHSVPMSDIFEEMAEINPGTVERVEVWITSYNNAGSGVDMYFDSVSLSIE